MIFKKFCIDALDAIRELQTLELNDEQKVAIYKQKTEITLLWKLYDIVNRQKDLQLRNERQLSLVRSEEERKLSHRFTHFEKNS